jgi:hypothetical protein
MTMKGEQLMILTRSLRSLLRLRAASSFMNSTPGHIENDRAAVGADLARKYIF